MANRKRDPPNLKPSHAYKDSSMSNVRSRRSTHLAFRASAAVALVPRAQPRHVVDFPPRRSGPAPPPVDIADSFREHAEGNHGRPRHQGRLVPITTKRRIRLPAGDKSIASKGLDTGRQIRARLPPNEGDFSYYCTVQPYKTGSGTVRKQ
jgi:hypothetical protein